ncbi:MAG: DNA recombination protein RmuC, partial [Candidatus Omnitrophota bacterium]|nr:DNA recombination protein RmuC [Candidatus Omnitrophota bacterium]
MNIILMLLILVNIIITAILIFRNQDSKLLKFERAIRDEMASNRQEIADSVKNFSDSNSKQLMDLTRLNEQKLDNIRNTVEERLKSLQDDNSQKLEQMRVTVDEKLHDTLEKRLGESCKMVK